MSAERQWRRSFARHVDEGKLFIGRWPGDSRLAIPLSGSCSSFSDWPQQIRGPQRSGTGLSSSGRTHLYGVISRCAVDNLIMRTGGL
jgi:hypothetical protein